MGRLEAVAGVLGRYLGEGTPPWSALEKSGGGFGGRPGLSWSHLGRLLGRLGGFTAASRVILGPSGGVPRLSESELEAVWGPRG